MSQCAEFLDELFGYLETGHIPIFQLPSRRTSFFSVEQPESGDWTDGPERVAGAAVDQHVYFGVGAIGDPPNRGRGSEGDVVAIPGLWLDVDVAGPNHKEERLPPTFEDALDLIYEFPLEPSIIVYTGGGLHGYWLFHEPWVFDDDQPRHWAARLSEKFQRHMMAVAGFQGWHVDPTHDLARIMRLPGTVNHKNNRPVEIYQNTGSRYSPREIGEWLKDFGLEPDPADAGGEVWQDTGDASTGSLDQAGGRNNRLKMIVAASLDRGESLEDTVFEVLKYDAKEHSPPLFSDATEFRSGHAYTNALRFVANVSESINRRRLRQDQQPQRFKFKDQEHSPSLAASERDVELFSFGGIYEDTTPEPPDLVSGGLVGPGEFLLIAGPPKSQKSLLLQDMLVHASLGRDFLGFDVLREMRVAFVNLEMSRRVLKRRIHCLNLRRDDVEKLKSNFLLTDRHHLTLDDAGAAKLSERLNDWFGDHPPDIIAIDPLVNIFPGETENDNQQMMEFLQRLESVRAAVNPDAGLVLVHHTKKIDRRTMAEDPFDAIRGAGALRGHYSSCIMIMKQSQDSKGRRLFFDVRIDESPEPMNVEFNGGRGRFEIKPPEDRLAGETLGTRFDREAKRKKHIIVSEIERLAMAEGRLVTRRQFAELLANRKGLGSSRSIQRKISELSSKGWLRFNDGEGLPPWMEIPHPNSDGYLVTEATQILNYDPETGQVLDPLQAQATHKKHPDTGATVPVDDGEPWIYHDDEEHPAADGVQTYKLKDRRNG